MKMPYVNSRGFTLVEVMVAMAVVAVALPALLFGLIQQLDGVEYLRDRSLASWVAANQLAELRLVVDKQGALPTGRIAGEAVMAGRDLHWWIDQQKTEIPGFIRVEVNVGIGLDKGEDAPMHTLTAFIAPEKADVEQ